jgi:hypothetical protein
MALFNGPEKWFEGAAFPLGLPQFPPPDVVRPVGERSSRVPRCSLLGLVFRSVVGDSRNPTDLLGPELPHLPTVRGRVVDPDPNRAETVIGIPCPPRLTAPSHASSKLGQKANEVTTVKH